MRAICYDKPNETTLERYQREQEEKRQAAAEAEDLRKKETKEKYAFVISVVTVMFVGGILYALFMPIKP